MLEALRVPPEPRAGQGSLPLGLLVSAGCPVLGVEVGRCSCLFLQRPSLSLDCLHCPPSLQTPKGGASKSVLPPWDLAKRVRLVYMFKNKSGRGSPWRQGP